jgi:hypothetical protein
VAEHEFDQTELRAVVARLQAEEPVEIETLRHLAREYVLAAYGEYMYPGIRKLPLDQPIRVKDNLRGMGCDGGFDPIPPQQIEYDASLTPLEVFTALLRAAVQFYAFSGPAELTLENGPHTRWGFLHLDQTGAPNTHFLGLQQDMVRYLTDEICRQLTLGIQTWMQRGESSHIQQLLEQPTITRDLLLSAFFGEHFVELVDVINGSRNTNTFVLLNDLSDQVDNARLCEFPSEQILGYEERYTREVMTIQR